MRTKPPEHPPEIDLTSGKCKFISRDGRTCNFPASLHRPVRSRVGRPDDRERDREDDITSRIISIDGEGVGENPHRYVYLAAADENGPVNEISDDRGLSTEACLSFIFGLPRRSLKVGFGLQYDFTKILRDLPSSDLYKLFRPELRKYTRGVKVVYESVIYKYFRLNYMNGKLTIGPIKKPRHKTSSNVVIWDIFKFFGKSFVSSLIEWKVEEKQKLEHMQQMKESRSNFNWDDNKQEIKDYCKSECQYLSKLTRRLIDSHIEIGYPLERSFHGPGSSAKVFLKAEKVVEYKGTTPELMLTPVASAFFGGRFENSVVGPILPERHSLPQLVGPLRSSDWREDNGIISQSGLWSYDISSAYPYQASTLPCLACGRWRYLRGHHAPKCLDPQYSLALVHWTSTTNSNPNAQWGPLPVRTKNREIVFPLAGLGGWTWRSEFEAALMMNANLGISEAWVYETSCDHKPFARLPELYRRRYEADKDSGLGLTLKLIVNSVYGQTCQSVGLKPKYQNWIWAGNITSGCRAQLLRAMALASSDDKILMVATDGIVSKERLPLEPKLDFEPQKALKDYRDKFIIPRDTGTSDLTKPLGGWEEKKIKTALFAVRPGIFFPLPCADSAISALRARGLGRKAVYENWSRIVDAWQAKLPSCTVGDGKDGKPPNRRFRGAKTSITRTRLYSESDIVNTIKDFSPEKQIRTRKELESRFKYRRTDYGEWTVYPIEVTFTALPKRHHANRDGTLAPYNFLNFHSYPYDKALPGGAPNAPESEEIQIQKAQDEIELEQIGANQL